MKRIFTLLGALLPIALFAQINTFPYSEDFEGALSVTTELPSDWQESGLSNDGIWAVDVATNASSSFFSYPSYSKFAYTNDDDCNCDKSDDKLITPVFDFSAQSQMEINFDYYTGTSGSDFLVVEISTDSGQTFTSIDTLSKVGSWTNHTVNLDVYTGPTFDEVAISFRYNDNGNWSYGAAVDNIVVQTPPTCLVPDTLTSSNITTTSADINWTDPNSATEWQIEYDTAGFTLGTGIDSIVTTTAIKTLASLTPNTAYEWYVRSVCGSGDTSAWSSMGSFNTLCNSFTIPYTESFNSTSTTQSCWTVLDANNDGDTWEMDATYAPFEGDEGVSIYTDLNGGANDDYLISPTITLTGGERLRYYVRARSSFEPNDYEVLVSTTGTGTTSFTDTLLRDTLDVTTYQERIIDLSAYTGNINVAFHIPQGGLDGWYLYIDSVSFEDIPSCLSPSSLAETNLTSDSVDLGWTENGTATEWQIEYDTAGFTLGTGTDSIVTTTAIKTLSGLTPNTAYEWYVRSICGSGDTSAWSSMGGFVTLCASFSPPYLEDFVNFLPSCWDEAEGTLSTNSSLVVGSSFWRDDNFGNTGSDNSAYLNLYSTNRDEWLISPTIDLGSGGTLYQLEFDIALTDYNSTSSTTLGVDDTIAVVISTDNGVTWSLSNVLQYWLPGSEPSNTGDHITLDLSAYSGEVKFAYYASSSVSNADNDVFVDNFEVVEKPNCPVPSSLAETNLTSDSVDLSWTENGTATEWQIEYDTVGFTLGAGVDSIVTTTAMKTLSGLTPNTAYEWYVRSICGSGDTSAWSSMGSFNTLCNAFTIPYTESFNSTSTTQSCWTVLDANSDGDTWDMDATYAPYEGDEGVSAYTDFNGGANDDYLISPTITLTGGERLRYYVRARSSFEPNDYEVLVSTAGTGTASFTDTLLRDTLDVTTYQERIIDLSTYTGNVNIAFHIPQGGLDGYYLYIDSVNFEDIPSCPVPSLLVETNLMSDSVDLSWTENGTATEWQIEYDTTGFTLGTGIDSIVTTTALKTLSGLTPNTAYEWYVRSVCGSGDTSAWSSMGSFVTSCNVISTFPYFEGFESNVPPECWSEEFESGTVNWTLSSGNSSSGSISAPHSGSSNALFYSNSYAGNSTSLITPSFDLTSLSNPQLKFWYTQEDWSSDQDTLGIYYRNSSSSAWVYLTSIDSSVVSWTEQVVNLPNPSADYSIKILAYSGYGYGVTIDDFEIGEKAICSSPSNLSFSNLSTDSVVLNWTENGTATEWQIEFDTTGFTLGAGNDTIVSSNPSTLSSLMINTNYDWYVRSICGSGDTSAWSNVSSFTTLLPHYPIGIINTEDANGDADSVNVECSISGTVVGYDRRGTNEYEFALVDFSTGVQEGITVFEFNDVSGYSNPTEGDSLLIFGHVDQFRGLTQFRPDSIVVLGTGTVPMPDTATTLDETTESILIQMNDWVLLDSTQASGSYNVTARSLDSTTTITIRIDSDSEISDSLAVVGNGWVVGDTICSLVGVGGQFDGFSSPFLGGYQVFPSLYADVTVCRLSTGIINVAAKAKSINIYPNPTVGQFTVKSSGLNNDNAIITVRDISGRVVLQDNIARSNSPFTKQYDLNGKAKGLYFISIIDGEERINQKLIVQ